MDAGLSTELMQAAMEMVVCFISVIGALFGLLISGR
jgi:hypothetical protein